MAGLFVPNPGFEREARESPEMAALLQEVSEDVASLAQDLAPVDDADYRDGIEAEVVSGAEGLEGRVNATDFKSVWIEMGTGHPGPTPAFRVLGRALEASGLSTG